MRLFLYACVCAGLCVCVCVFVYAIDMYVKYGDCNMLGLLLQILIVLWITKSLDGADLGWGGLLNDYPGNGSVTVSCAFLPNAELQCVASKKASHRLDVLSIWSVTSMCFMCRFLWQSYSLWFRILGIRKRSSWPGPSAKTSIGTSFSWWGEVSWPQLWVHPLSLHIARAHIHTHMHAIHRGICINVYLCILHANVYAFVYVCRGYIPDNIWHDWKY